MSLLTPETSPLMCMGCSSAFMPDPPSEQTGNTIMGGICPKCDGPLQRVSAVMVMGMALEAPHKKGQDAPDPGDAGDLLSGGPGRFGPAGGAE